jgi:hypothetical protein
MGSRKRELHDLLERDIFVVDDARARIDDDFIVGDRLRPRDKVLNPRRSQVDELMTFDETQLSAGAFQKHGPIFCNVAKLIKIRTFNRRLPPLQLTLIERQPVNAVGIEADEPLGSALTEIEWFVQADLFKVPIRKNGEEAKLFDWSGARGLKYLPPKRSGVRQVERAKV